MIMNEFVMIALNQSVAMLQTWDIKDYSIGKQIEQRHLPMTEAIFY